MEVVRLDDLLPCFVLRWYGCGWAGDVSRWWDILLILRRLVIACDFFRRDRVGIGNIIVDIAHADCLIVCEIVSGGVQLRVVITNCNLIFNVYPFCRPFLSRLICLRIGW